jgi:hypothetical protein
VPDSELRTSTLSQSYDPEIHMLRRNREYSYADAGHQAPSTSEHSHHTCASDIDEPAGCLGSWSVTSEVDSALAWILLFDEAKWPPIPSAERRYAIIMLRMSVPRILGWVNDVANTLYTLASAAFRGERI